MDQGLYNRDPDWITAGEHLDVFVTIATCCQDHSSLLPRFEFAAIHLHERKVCKVKACAASDNQEASKKFIKPRRFLIPIVLE